MEYSEIMAVEKGSFSQYPDDLYIKNDTPLSFETIVAKAETWADSGRLSEADIAVSGIISHLRKLDEGDRNQSGRLGIVREKAIGVITRALNSGVTAVMDHEFSDQMTMHAAPYREWLGEDTRWDTKTLALAGQKDALAGTLRTYANHLDHQDTVRRRQMQDGKKYSENYFRQLYNERDTARQIADLIMPLEETKVVNLAETIITVSKEVMEKSLRSKQEKIATQAEETVVFALTIEDTEALGARSKRAIAEEQTKKPYDVYHEQEYYKALLVLTRLPDESPVVLEVPFDVVPQDGTTDNVVIRPLDIGRFTPSDEEYRDYLSDDT